MVCAQKNHRGADAFVIVTLKEGIVAEFGGTNMKPESVTFTSLVHGAVNDDWVTD